MDFSITDTKISSNAVITGKVADGAITDSKISGTIAGSKLGSHTHNGTDIVDGTITTSKISDGAVTDEKISGPISTSKFNVGTMPGTVAAGDHNHDALYQKKYENVVVVAKSGGDFTSIQAAIDSITPTAENPYLIKVMPGTYYESINLKSFVHLQGAGHEATKIASSGFSNDPAIEVVNISNVMISDLAVQLDGEGIYNVVDGIYIQNSSSVTVIGNRLSARQGYYCIVILNSSPNITGNTINNCRGIWAAASAGEYRPIISKNIITNASRGITLYGYSGGYYNPSPEITDNIIKEGDYGIVLVGSSPRIMRNSIINNQTADIYLEPAGYFPSSSPNISFNVYDSITGTTGVGMFNVKSNGSSW